MAPTSYRTDLALFFQLVQIVPFLAYVTFALMIGDLSHVGFPQICTSYSDTFNTLPISAVDTLLDQAILPHPTIRSPRILSYLYSSLNKLGIGTTALGSFKCHQPFPALGVQLYKRREKVVERKMNSHGRRLGQRHVLSFPIF